MSTDLILMVAAAWLIASVVLLVRLRVFSAGPLRRAPSRESSLSLLHFLAAIALYIGLQFFVFSVLQAVSPVKPPPRSEPAAATTEAAAASGPATTSAPITASAAAVASAPATAPSTQVATTTPSTRPAVYSHNAWFMRMQHVDMFAKVGATVMLLLVAHRLVVGGVKGFGLSIEQLVPGIMLGALAFFIVFPLLGVLNIVVSWIGHIVRNGAPAPVHRLLEEFERPDAGFASQALITFAAVVIAPVVEEIAFRGVLQTALLRLFQLPRGPAETHGFPVEVDGFGNAAPDLVVAETSRAGAAHWAAAMIAAIAFTAVHFDSGNWEGLTLLLLLAAALGYVYERTGNLWASITLHAAFNGTSILLFAAQTGR